MNVRDDMDMPDDQLRRFGTSIECYVPPSSTQIRVRGSGVKDAFTALTISE